MPHSKGLFSGSCPGKLVRQGSPRDGYQLWKCGKCGQVQRKRVRKCVFFHDWQKSGRPDHGHQRMKCDKCGDTQDQYVSGCGRLLGRHAFHNCKKVPGTHCRYCAQRRLSLFPLCRGEMSDKCIGQRAIAVIVDVHHRLTVCQPREHAAVSPTRCAPHYI